MTIALLIFVTSSLALSLAIVVPVVSYIKTVRAATLSKQALYTAEAAHEDAMYRVKNSLAISSNETLTIGNTMATAQIANLTGSKQITTTGDASGYERGVQSTVIESEGVSFNYGMQSGLGGFDMQGGATINGNVYSNGDIVGNGGPVITGSATVANQSNPTADQSNGTDTVPPFTVAFGENASPQVQPQDIGQGFKVSTTTVVTSVRLYIKKYSTAWMNNATVKITNDNGGKPGKTKLVEGNLPADQITTSFGYITVPFTSTVSLAPGTQYWIVIDTGGTWGNYYTVGATDATYASGTAKVGTWNSSNGGTWSDTSPTGRDIYFDIFLGGDVGKIIGPVSIGGDAWANTITNSTITGISYCQAGSNNNKACNTSRSDPTQTAFPISDGNINDWKEEALVGGTYTGDYDLGSNQTLSLGPKKIVGNIDVGSGATLNVTGTLWVTGNIDISGGGKIKLASSFSNTSGVIVVDGKVDATGGGNFQGSGTTGSYIIVVSTSACPSGTGCSGDPAIKVSGGTGAVVLNAQKGTVQFSGGAQAKQVTAYKVVMDGGTTVNYETGLADINFNSGPSGSWSIDSWNELAQ